MACWQLWFAYDIIEQDDLYKMVKRNCNVELKLPWLPTLMISEVLHPYHDHPMSGHFGIKRTYDKIKDKFY
jgi:hypothetical protein